MVIAIPTPREGDCEVECAMDRRLLARGAMTAGVLLSAIGACSTGGPSADGGTDAPEDAPVAVFAGTTVGTAAGTTVGTAAGTTTSTSSSGTTTIGTTGATTATTGTTGVGGTSGHPVPGPLAPPAGPEPVTLGARGR
jgi:hypothetical protein